MRKLKSWVKIVLFLVIVAIIIGFYYKEPIMHFVSMDPCKDEVPELKSECYVKEAVEHKDLSICYDKLQNNKTISYCEHEIAIALNDASLCKSITTAVWKSSCFSKIGIASNDSSLCFKSTFAKDKVPCFYEIAKATRELKVCLYIENELDRFLCMEDIAIITNDTKICDSMSKDFGKELKMIQCYTNFALFTNNIKICSKLEGQFKDNCLAQFEVKEKE